MSTILRRGSSSIVVELNENTIAKKIIVNDNCNLVPVIFLREMTILSTLNHPFIRKIEGVVMNHKTKEYSLIMKKGDCTLTSLVQSGKVIDKARVIKDIALSLYYLEQNNVLHGDLKSDNIIMFKKNDYYQPVIIDFGIYYKESLRDSYIDGEISSKQWKAPEEIHNMTVCPTFRDFKTISWAFGILVLFIYTGSLNHRKRCEVEELINKCLCQNPEKRISMHDICLYLGCSVEKPLTLEEKLQRDFIKDESSPDFYNLFTELANENKFLRYCNLELALGLYNKSRLPISEVVVVACLTIAIKSCGYNVTDTCIKCNCSIEDICATEIEIIKRCEYKTLWCTSHDL